MRGIAKILLTVLVLALNDGSPAIAGMSAGKINIHAGYNLPALTFSKCCPKPEWWNNVDAPVVTTKQELLKIWQNRAIEKNVKAKVFYRAMMEFDGKNDDIVSTAISLYQFVDGEYPNRTQMLEFGVGRFFKHKRSLNRYSGKIGDTSAGLVNKLARRYLKQKKPEDAAALIAKMISTRGSEINQQLLERLSLTMIDALNALGRQDDAFAVASYAIDNYHGDWEKNLKQKRDALRPSISTYQQILLSFPKLMIFLLAGLAALTLLIGIFAWSKRPQRHNHSGKLFRYGRNSQP